MSTKACIDRGIRPLDAAFTARISLTNSWYRGLSIFVKQPLSTPRPSLVFSDTALPYPTLVPSRPKIAAGVKHLGQTGICGDGRPRGQEREIPGPVLGVETGVGVGSQEGITWPLGTTEHVWEPSRYELCHDAPPLRFLGCYVFCSFLACRV